MNEQDFTYFVFMEFKKLLYEKITTEASKRELDNKEVFSALMHNLTNLQVNLIHSMMEMLEITEEDDKKQFVFDSAKMLVKDFLGKFKLAENAVANLEVKVSLDSPKTPIGFSHNRGVGSINIDELLPEDNN